MSSTRPNCAIVFGAGIIVSSIAITFLAILLGIIEFNDSWLWLTVGSVLLNLLVYGQMDKYVFELKKASSYLIVFIVSGFSNIIAFIVAYFVVKVSVFFPKIAQHDLLVFFAGYFLPMFGVFISISKLISKTARITSSEKQLSD